LILDVLEWPGKRFVDFFLPGKRQLLIAKEWEPRGHILHYPVNGVNGYVRLRENQMEAQRDWLTRWNDVDEEAARKKRLN
jgi:hypothetical protein